MVFSPTASRGGVVTFFQQGFVDKTTRAVFSYKAGSGEASYVGDPAVRVDSALLTNRALVTDVDGANHDRVYVRSINKYGEYATRFTVFSNRNVAQVQADWWALHYGFPVPRIESVTVLPHLESYNVMRKLLPLTIGSGVNVHTIAPDISEQVDGFSVDGLTVTIRPLNQRSLMSAVTMEVEYRLWPLGNIIEWALGTSRLGDCLLYTSPSPRD